MDYKTLLQNLKIGKIAPIYFFHGEEKYAIDEAVKQVIQYSVSPEVKDFNLDIFYGNDIDSRKVLDIVAAYPMMSDRRTIVIKEFHKVAINHLKNMAQYAESPIASSCLVLVATASNLKGKSYDTIKKNAVSLEFRPLYDDQIGPWIKQYVSKMGKDISVQAIQMLQACVGNSLLNLVNELDKVFLNIDDRKNIELKDVQAVVGITKEFNIFNLINSIGFRDLKNSMLIINHLLDRGESPAGIIVRLTNFFSTLLKFSENQIKRLSDKDLAKTVGINYYFLKDYKIQAKNYSAAHIEKAFALLLEADLHIKTGYQTPKFVIELLIYKLINL